MEATPPTPGALGAAPVLTLAVVNRCCSRSGLSQLVAEEDVLCLLPSAIRGQIMLHMTGHLLDSVPGIADMVGEPWALICPRIAPLAREGRSPTHEFLFCFGSTQPLAMKLSLAHRLELQVFAPGDVILTEGQQGSHLFFIAKGSIVMSVGGVRVSVLGPGSYFGDVAAILQRCVRRMTIWAVYRVVQLGMQPGIRVGDGSVYSCHETI